MPWTNEQKIESLMRLPWTVTSEAADDADEFVVRVKELPGTIVVGKKEEIEAVFWDVLRAGIEARLEFGDQFELPPGTACLPWEAVPVRAAVRRVVAVQASSSLTALSQPYVFS